MYWFLHNKSLHNINQKRNEKSHVLYVQNVVSNAGGVSQLKSQSV